MNQPTCSIIINTYNRAPYLRRLLAGLAHLDGMAFEVVIVNGPSTDATATLLEEYRGRVKVVECPTRNLSQSRNLGIAAAAGAIVVFIDDDALPGDARWLAHYVAAFAADTEGRLGALGGPVRHRDSGWLEFNGGITSDYGFQIFDGATTGGPARDGRSWFRRVQGCNCAFRRSALVAIGGFDEFFTYYHDETDVCLRLARAGFATLHLPDNAVRHYAAPSERRTSPYDRNWRVVARSDTYFALKNGADPLPRRLLKTLAAAPYKHYVGEINSYLRKGKISIPHWLRLTGQWGAGLLDGLRAGLRLPRRLGDFRAAPPPWLPFAAPPAERRLRIALLTQSVPGQPGAGGIGRYTFDLAQGLHERGHEVHILCKDSEPLRHVSLGFQIHGIPAGRPGALFSENRPVLNKNLGYALAIVDRLAGLREQGLTFDVVHASNWNCEAVALIRAKMYPTVLMLVSPLAQVIRTEDWRADDDMRACIALDRWQIEHADAVCMPSQGVWDSYATLMDLDRESIAALCHTPLGIMPDRAPVVAAPGGRRRLLFVGRYERRKGIHTLLDVLPDVLAAAPDWECHLVGDDRVPLAETGTFKQQFLARHRRALWLNRVFFHGEVDEDELRHQYRCCDLFVAPSLFESFGLIYHEAMQYGKPVIGCRTGGVSEVVAHGIEGLLVAPDSPGELRAALAQLMGDAALRRRMGEAGARRIREFANYQTMAARLEQIYYETIARSVSVCS